MDRKLTLVVSGTLLVAMFTHAWQIVAHGATPSEVHFITSAPLTVVVSSSSSAATTATDYYVQHNAVTEAVHPTSVPREDELRLGGLTVPLP